MESNVQKMQKALDKIIVITTEWQGSIPFGEVHKIAKAARKLPLRNCDIGTPEEQYRKFQDFCNTIHHSFGGVCSKNCPLYSRCNVLSYQNTGRAWCFPAWAQMPYEAGEGGAK